MMVYVKTVTSDGRYKVQAKTADGTLVGQALDSDRAAAERRAIRQARHWAEDRNLGPLVIRKEAP